MPDSATVPASGLRTLAGNPIPLEGISVEAEIRDFCSRVTVAQRFRNAESQPIEAVYVFPLDEGAAVCGFEALIGGTRVVGRVKQKEAAFAEYDVALAAGHGAYLLDQERPDVFTASVGNLRPGDEVLVRVTYVAELLREGEAIRFTLPTTVSPRYAPAQDQRGVGRTPAMALNPPLAWTVPYGLELRVAVEMASPIRSLESPSHPVSVETEGTRATVRLAAREAALDRDFVLKIGLAEAHVPRTWLETTPGGETVALLAFEPRFTSREAAGEIVFLVDRSGSMKGSSIVEARNALQLCLRSLREGWLFNVVGFGSTFRALFSESQPYDQGTLTEANRYDAALAADLGGTEILPALAGVLERPSRPGFPRQLFVLTDGQVTNTEAVLALVRKHSSDTRVFTFGIGAGASAHLVRGIARAGEGEAEFIHPGERIEAKVMRQLKRAMAPAFTDVVVDWGGLKVRQAPHRPAAVFDGGRVLVYGFLEKAETASVSLRARGSGGPVSFTARLDPAVCEKGTLLATLAARRLIRDLEEGQSPLHDRRGSLQERAGSGDGVKAQLVKLGVTYGLCSRETSFVAVEERETPVEDDAVLRRVPVALTSGWGGAHESGSRTGSAILGADFSRGRVMGRNQVLVGRGALGSVYQDLPDLEASPGWDTAPSAPGALSATPSTPLHRSSGSLARRIWEILRSWRRRQRNTPAREEGPAPASAEPDRPLDRLVALQRADGSWALTEELSRLIGRRLSELEQSLAGASGDAEEARRAWATALALRWLVRYPELRPQWEMLADKATTWLAGRTVRPPGGGDWARLAASTMG